MKEIYQMELGQARTELTHYKAWVADLQSGMYINCMFCGFRYGPSNEKMQERLEDHIYKCSKHPIRPLMDLLIQWYQDADHFGMCTDSGCELCNGMYILGEHLKYKRDGTLLEDNKNGR